MPSPGAPRPFAVSRDKQPESVAAPLGLEPHSHAVHKYRQLARFPVSFLVCSSCSHWSISWSKTSIRILKVPGPDPTGLPHRLQPPFLFLRFLAFNDSINYTASMFERNYKVSNTFRVFCKYKYEI